MSESVDSTPSAECNGERAEPQSRGEPDTRSNTHATMNRAVSLSDQESKIVTADKLSNGTVEPGEASVNDISDVAADCLTASQNMIIDTKATDKKEQEDEDVSEGESVDDRDEQYRRRAMDLKKRIGLAPKRRQQYNQYMNILEDRIAALEDRCERYDRMRGKTEHVKSEAEEATEEEQTSKRKINPELNFLYWDAFLEDKGGKSTHAIDVLLGEPTSAKAGKIVGRSVLLTTVEEVLSDLQSDKIATKDSGDVKRGIEKLRSRKIPERPPDDKLVPKESGDVKKGIEKLRTGTIPERIRINSYALRTVLQKILGTKPEGDNIFLRPYKAFIYRGGDIRDIMNSLVRQIDEILAERTSEDRNPDGVLDSNPSPVRNGNEIQNTQQPDMNTETLPLKTAMTIGDWTGILEFLDLHHCTQCTEQVLEEWPSLEDVKASFKALDTLLDEYIRPVHNALRERTRESVYFRDLWHLFRPGDKIAVRVNQTFDEDIAGKLMLKVLRTSGGRHVLRHGRAPAFDPSEPISEKDRLSPENNINPFCIQAYYLDFNGFRLVPVRRRFVISPYPGERNINTLNVFPIQYLPKNDGSLESMRNRGNAFVRFAMSTDGTYSDCAGSELRTKEDLNDKVIVDMKEYFRFEEHKSNIPVFDEPEGLDISETNDCRHGETCTEDCPHRTMLIIPDQGIEIAATKAYRDQCTEFKQFFTQEHDSLEPLPDYEICHYRLFAYKLRSREWVEINVNCLSRPKGDEVGIGFENLVLPKDHKNILASQVREHFRKRNSQSLRVAAEDDMDLVRGKGQGLIILLHGAPGVGKTATAECIAEFVRKPLYPITCGDLGSTAAEVELNLKKHFTLASRWDCVMLLDEADVFLAKRKPHDLLRNSIVSVFLRMLEYYKGLLFLTTNRIGTFDEAFKSRVHISLFYPNFDEETTIKVWETFITQTRKALKRNGRTQIHVDKEEILSFARSHWKKNPNAHWNGRQIRNAFHTAVAMAEFHARGGNSLDVEYDERSDIKIEIGKRQFRKIASTVQEFDLYIQDALGVTYDNKAAKEKLRAPTKATKSGKKSYQSESDTSSEDEKRKPKKSKKQSKRDTDTSSSSSEEEERSKRSKKHYKKRRDGGASGDELAKPKKPTRDRKDVKDGSNSESE